MAYGQVVWFNKADGWVIADDELTAILMKTENTEWGYSGIVEGSVVCPQWVQDAYETYKQNGGFAGMSPGEYIDRLADGKQTRPQHTF